MQLTAETVIDQPRETVWKFFTNPQTWKDWYGGALAAVEPDWEAGAVVRWGAGPPSTLGECVPQETVSLVSRSGLRLIFRFSDAPGGATRASYTEDFSESSTVVNNVATRQAACQSTIDGLKRQVEAAQAPPPVLKTSPQKPWWQFWK